MPNKSTFPNRSAMPDRRFLLVSGTALLLTGCGNIIGPPDAPQIYMLHATTAAAPIAAGPKVSWALAIERPDASESLNTDRIALVRGDMVLDYYAKAVWADRIPVLVQTALLASFESSGRIDAVARDDDALHADYVLSAEIRDFSAQYATPDAPPKVTVTLVAHIDRAHGRTIVGNFTTTQSVPASANTTASAVQAFDAALSAAAAAVATWALALPAPPPPGSK